MADTMTPDVPDVPVEDENFKVELVEEGAVDDKTAELEAKNAELEAKMAELLAAQQAPAPVAAPDPGLSALAQEIAKMREEPKQEAVPETDYNKVIEETSKNFYNDPTKSVLGLMTPVVQQLKAENDQRANQQAMQISKLTVLSTPGDKELYMKYKDEVDSAASALPPSEEAYQKALAQVKVNHVDDLVEERINAALEQATAKAEQAASTAAPQAPVNLSTMPARTAPQPSNKLSPTQWRDLQQQAMIKGFDIGTADRLTADGVWAIQRYKENGGRL